MLGMHLFFSLVADVIGLLDRLIDVGKFAQLLQVGVHLLVADDR